MARLTLYFDNRRKDANGCGTLRAIIRNAGTTAYIALDIKVPESCWDGTKVTTPQNGEVLKFKPSVLNNMIRSKMARLEMAMQEVVGIKSNLSAARIRSLVLAQANKDEVSGMSFDAFARVLVDDDATAKSTASKIVLMLHKFEACFYKYNDIYPSDLDIDMMARFYKFLVNDPSLAIATANSYFHTARYVWHCACKRGLASRDIDPFDGIRLKRYVSKIKPLPLDDVRRLWFYEPDPKDFPKRTASWMRKARMYRDYAKLTICLCGMNAADIIRLTDKSIRQGRVEVQRAKTGVPISIKLEPEALELIKNLREGELLTGVLHSKSGWKQKGINKGMGIIVPGLTTYALRKAWATIAASIDVPNEVIAMGLGHSYGNEITNLYITPSLSRLDKANRRVLDFIQGIGEFGVCEK